MYVWWGIDPRKQKPPTSSELGVGWGIMSRPFSHGYFENAMLKYLIKPHNSRRLHSIRREHLEDILKWCRMRVVYNAGPFKRDDVHEEDVQNAMERIPLLLQSTNRKFKVSIP